MTALFKNRTIVQASSLGTNKQLIAHAS